MIVVTGATGNVGSAAVRELLSRGERVRAFVRDPRKASERFGDGAEIVAGDFADAASIARAVEGAGAVLLSSADGPEKVGYETAVIAAARAAGVRKIVKVSTVGAEAGSPLPPFDWHGRIEDALRSSGLDVVVLHSYFYMSNVFMSADGVKATGKLFAPAAGAKVATVDPRDTGVVAAIALTTGEYDGTTLTLSGPEAITWDEIAAALSEATGRTVEFVSIPDEAAREALTAAGMPGWVIAHLGALFPLLRDGALADPTDTVRTVTGRAPRTFAAFARDHAGVFA